MPVKKPLEDMTTQELLWNAEGNLMKANLDQNGGTPLGILLQSWRIEQVLLIGQTVNVSLFIYLR